MYSPTEAVPHISYSAPRIFSCWRYGLARQNLQKYSKCLAVRVYFRKNLHSRCLLNFNLTRVFRTLRTCAVLESLLLLRRIRGSENRSCRRFPHPNSHPWSKSKRLGLQRPIRSTGSLFFPIGSGYRLRLKKFRSNAQPAEPDLSRERDSAISAGTRVFSSPVQR